MKELNYTQLDLVLSSWELVRRIPNYQQVAGALLFTKFFEKSRDALALFGWSRDADPRSPEVLESRKFRIQTVVYIQALDAALDMLGPDIGMMTEILEELGERHSMHYGVTPDLYPLMGESVIEVLEDVLKQDFTPGTKDAWSKLWTELSKDMIKSGSSSALSPTSKNQQKEIPTGQNNIAII